MSNYDKIIEKWINGKFDSKIIPSLTKQEQYFNINFSIINGKEYSTKLGNGMSAQIGRKDLKELITVLVDIDKRLEENQGPIN